MTTLNPHSPLYRLSTMYNSCKALYHLSPEQVNAFIKSYDIYDYDWIDGQAMDHEKPVDYSAVKTGILDWYGVLNHLCALGPVEKMYIPPALDLSKSLIDNQLLFEQRFSKILGIQPNDKVFELGCGKGRVAAHLASTTGANIIGINIDQGQLNNAIAFAHHNGLSQQCQFMNADLNEIPFPFPDRTFDSIYEIQAFSLSRHLPTLFKELSRILKPGGKISLLEWVKLPAFDEKNPHHQQLMRQIKPLIGAIGTPRPAEIEAILKQLGFNILVSEDPSINHTQEPLIHKADHFFNKLSLLTHFLAKTRILPQHFVTLFEKLQQDVEAFCEGTRLGIITTSYHIVAQKRLK